MKEHLSVRPDQTFTTFFSAAQNSSSVESVGRKPESTTFSTKVSALYRVSKQEEVYKGPFWSKRSLKVM